MSIMMTDEQATAVLPLLEERLGREPTDDVAFLERGRRGRRAEDTELKPLVELRNSLRDADKRKVAVGGRTLRFLRERAQVREANGDSSRDAIHEMLANTPEGRTRGTLMARPQELEQIERELVERIEELGDEARGEDRLEVKSLRRAVEDITAARA